MNARALLSWVSVGRIVMFALLGGGVQSSPAATMYPNVITSGHGLSRSTLLAQGWTVLYDTAYATSTTTANVDYWRNMAGSGYVLLAGTDAAGNILLGAAGLASEVLAHTFSTTVAYPRPSSSMYWYNRSSSSVGFAPSSNIYLYSADVVDSSLMSGTGGPWRLSWHLDAGGGWRIGNLTWLNSDVYYRKLVMMASGPLITVNGPALDFGSVEIETVSAPLNYSVSAVNLNTALSITAPAGFQVSTSSDAGFGGTIALSHSNGTIGTTTIYVRFSPGSLGLQMSQITHVSHGAVTKTLAIEGIGVPPPPGSLFRFQ